MSQLEIYTNLPYVVRVVPEKDDQDGLVYLATNPELPGCMSHGDTPEEAIRRLAEARELYLSTMLERGLEPPLPTAITAATTSGGAGSQVAIWKVHDIEIKEAEPSQALGMKWEEPVSNPA